MGAKLRATSDGGWAYRCPCGDHHVIRGWVFNGDMECPTFSPSVLVRSGHYARNATPTDCWCTYNKEHPDEGNPVCYVCHSYVRNGAVEFLGDCTHALAGRTVPLPDFDKPEE